MVLLTLIARRRDGLILATSIEGADDRENSFVKYTSQAKLLFRRLSSENGPNERSVTSDPYVFHYIIRENIATLCLCNQNFPRNSAFAYLEDVTNKFIEQYGTTRIEQVLRPYHFVEFDTYIQQAKRKYTDKNRFAMSAVSNELQDVQRIMFSNIEDMLHRSEALNILETRADGLYEMSKKYRDDAKLLNQKSAIFKIFVGMGVAGFLFFILKFLIF
uniref:Vesicle-trafficking protein SEC22b n=1 Tax=Parastrongyloides trichosuri TaxID=131310 RepID=A0A0N4Z0M5_PARTI